MITDCSGGYDNSEYECMLEAISTYCKELIWTVAPIVPAVKINIAYFEKYLYEGIELFYNLIAEAKDAGLIVVADVKRGDIGHTAEQYGLAHLQDPPFEDLDDITTADAITINGFAGSDGIEPFAKVAAKNGKGVFVWVRASNPSAAAIQDFADTNGVKMYEKLAEIVADSYAQPHLIGTSGYSSLGMVIGGTTSEQTAQMRTKYDKCIFLVPGFGSQGATAADCVKFCKPDGTGALINASRSIIYAHTKPQYSEKFTHYWQKCVQQAAIDAKAELTKAIEQM